MRLSSVLLPEPDGPRTAFTSPRSTPNDTPRRTSLRPYRLRMSTASRSGPEATVETGSTTSAPSSAGSRSGLWSVIGRPSREGP